MNATGESRKLYERGWALLGMNRPAEAIPLFLQALGMEPDDAYVLCGLSSAYHSLEDWPTALRYADQAIAADPYEEWGFRRRSYSLEAMGQNEAALAAALEAVRLEPEDPNCLRQLVCTQRNCGQLHLAEQTARRLLEIAPDDASSHTELGLVFHYQKRYWEAEACNRKALTLNPESVTALNNLGLALKLQGYRQEALECYYQALRTDPTDKLVLDNLESQVKACGFASVEAYLQSRGDAALWARIGPRLSLQEQARTLLDQNNAAQAIERLHQALMLAPYDIAVLILLAEGYARLGDLYRALQYADQVIRMVPHDGRGYRWRGWILNKMSQMPGLLNPTLRQDALAAAQEAVRLSEADPGSLETLCLIQQECGLLGEAEQTAKQLLAAAPNWWCAYKAIGDLYGRQGHWRVAEMYFRQAVECAPDCAAAINDVGLALWNQNRKGQAGKCFAQALQLEPANLTYQQNVRMAAPRRFFGLW